MRAEKAPYAALRLVLGASLLVACGSSDPSTGSALTHPAGVLDTPTAVPGAPFGIAVLGSGKIITARLANAFAILPAGGGSFVSGLAGAVPTDVTYSVDGVYAYLTHQGAQELGRIELSIPQVTAILPLPFNPYRIVRSHAGTTLFVTGNSDSVLSINLATGARQAAYGMEVNQNGLVETADGARLYVSSPTGGVVREITVATGAVGRTFTVGGTAQDVALSLDGKRLFVAVENSNFIQVWTVSSGTRTDSIDVGSGTFGLALAPDGTRLYATAPADGQVFIIDPATLAILDALPVGGTPRRIGFNAGGSRAVVSNEAGWVDFIH